MPITITKVCQWCGASMETTRSSKRLCSARCHQAFHRWRQSILPGAGPKDGFKLIQDWMAENSHPNSNHPVNKLDESLSDFCKAATEVVTQNTNQLKSTIAVEQSQPEEIL